MKKTFPALLAALAMAAATAWAQAPDIEAEVTKVDKAAGRVTLRHGAVKKLDMPAMTMAYRVADPKLLEGVSVGDRVRFAADRVGGSYTVTALVKAP